MKNLFFIFSILFSVTSFAQRVEYIGQRHNGESCKLFLDIDMKDAALGDCAIQDRKAKIKDNKLTIRGGADFLDCKIHIKLDEQGQPIEASLSTRHILKPIFTRVLKCNDLRVKANEIYQ